MKIRVWKKRGLLPPTVSFVAESFIFQDDYRAIRFVTNLSELRRGDTIIDAPGNADISAGDVVVLSARDRHVGRGDKFREYFTEVFDGRLRLDSMNHRVLIHRPFRDLEFFETMA